MFLILVLIHSIPDWSSFLLLSYHLHSVTVCLTNLAPLLLSKIPTHRSAPSGSQCLSSLPLAIPLEPKCIHRGIWEYVIWGQVCRQVSLWQCLEFWAGKSLFPPRETWLPLQLGDVFSLRLRAHVIHKWEERNYCFLPSTILKIIDMLGIHFQGCSYVNKWHKRASTCLLKELILLVISLPRSSKLVVLFLLSIYNHMLLYLR